MLLDCVWACRLDAWVGDMGALRSPLHATVLLTDDMSIWRPPVELRHGAKAFMAASATDDIARPVGHGQDTLPLPCPISCMGGVCSHFV